MHCLFAVVVYLDPQSSRVPIGNKSVYRTRMAIADDGDPIVLAPGVRQFGEDGNDEFIRKYISGRDRILNRIKPMRICRTIFSGSPLDPWFIRRTFQNHLCGRKANQVWKEYISNYMSYEEAVKKYNPENLKTALTHWRMEKLSIISAIRL